MVLKGAASEQRETRDREQIVFVSVSISYFKEMHFFACISTVHAGGSTHYSLQKVGSLSMPLMPWMLCFYKDKLKGNEAYLH
jgi:hypothetical protein